MDIFNWPFLALCNHVVAPNNTFSILLILLITLCVYCVNNKHTGFWTCLFVRQSLTSLVSVILLYLYFDVVCASDDHLFSRHSRHSTMIQARRFMKVQQSSCHRGRRRGRLFQMCSEIPDSCYFPNVSPIPVQSKLVLGTR